ncbi:mitochondrial genome maintenance exonuclease 1-like [Eschrichtius robustus]|uniref:mitochondrial genome maintenance exonuclease 1-like n=1 Tax=Eschrichtius robustus TaxID=9764 RepID=UPI0035C0BC72
MKVFQTICRQLISSKGYSVKPAPSVVFSTSSYTCGGKKKVNRYEEVDQKKYSDLVRSVLSFRGHAQTPHPLFEEDALLYGPVRKCKAPKQEEETGGPRNWGPIFSLEKSRKPNATNDPTIPLKITLQRNMIPRVTRVLQQTMNSEQTSCLERWKQWMILELGEDGFAEYTSGSVWLDHGGLQRRVPHPPTFHGRRALLPVLGKVTSSTRRIYKEGKEPEYSETRLGAGSCVGTFRTFSQFGKMYCCFL